MWKVILASTILLLTLTGCTGLISMKKNNSNAIEKRTAEEILTDDPAADIFQYNGLIYSKSKNKEIDDEISLEKGKQVSEIKKQTTDHDDFIDGTATLLTIGTKIYQVTGQGLAVLAIIKYGKVIIYLAEIT